MEFKVLTEAEIKELSERGRALLSGWLSAAHIFVGPVLVERFVDSDYGDGYCMGIYLDRGAFRADCHVENQWGHLIEEGEEFAARRALKVLRAHMVLDDLARI